MLDTLSKLPETVCLSCEEYVVVVVVVPVAVADVLVVVNVVPGIVDQSVAPRTFSVPPSLNRVVVGSTINTSGCFILSTHTSIGGLISNTPSAMDTANGFKLTVSLANFCKTKFAVEYGNVTIDDAPPEFVWYL